MKQAETVKQTDKSRRRVVAGLAGGGIVASGTVLPAKWTRPVIETVILPAHAKTSEEQDSDNRLKESIEKIASFRGINFYRWRWNSLAESLCGLSGSSVGVIAQEMVEIFPDVVGRRSGYLTVNYGKLWKRLFR